jgi:hypothetical protein
METVIRTNEQGEDATYQVENGTYYNKNTPKPVIDLLEMARKFRYYVWMRLGDRNTGRDWMDQWDLTGFIGRSTGPIRIPLLLATSRSMGGGGVMSDSIVRIVVNDRRGRRHEWKHPLYVVPDLVIEHDPNGKTPVAVVVRKRHEDLSIQARFPNRVKAQRWVDFITGRRLNR